MKKIIGVLILCVSMAFTSQAQSATALVSATGYAADTVTSSTAHYLLTGIISGRGSSISIVLKATEISGTTAGTCTLQASVDGATWYDYYPGTVTTDSAGGNTRLSLADVSTAQTFRWIVKGTESDRYYRVKVVGISTVNVRIEGKYFVKL